MQLIDLIMNTAILKADPPILLDVGASGNLHYKWKDIAEYSICIAFDPDARDIATIQENQIFKKTYFINSLVSYEEKNSENFYLTRSPYCSSMLRPLQDKVDYYSFGYLFEVEKTVKVNATTLKNVLGKLSIDKVDWIKTDSQGIDLKIFRSLPKWQSVITVEFEPGFIDAYESEDKIIDVLSFMENQNFWLSEFLAEGDVRISKNVKEKYFSDYKNKRLTSIIKTNPCWAGMTYMNDFSEPALNNERDYLLGILFNYIDNNFGYCLELCDKASNQFESNIFKETLNVLLKEKDRPESKSINTQNIFNHLEFNKNLNKALEKLKKLSAFDEKFILYGAGTGAEFIMNCIPNSIEHLVDIDDQKTGTKFLNKFVYPLNKLQENKKRVIISVFGREREITKLLIDKYGLENSQIISLW